MASGSRGNRRSLDAPRYEHDSCGVGFVAAVPAPARPVLPLALAGLAALGHRGAFGADGESSDGAGYPALERELVEHLAPGLGIEARDRQSSCRGASRDGASEGPRG